jgi:hypothetical protein
MHGYVSARRWRVPIAIFKPTQLQWKSTTVFSVQMRSNRIMENLVFFPVTTGYIQNASRGQL